MLPPAAPGADAEPSTVTSGVAAAIAATARSLPYARVTNTVDSVVDHGLRHLVGLART